MSKILIVDDTALMRMTIKDRLRKGGYSEFIEAENGEMALTEYQENQPDLVLLDITMPIMDGIQALQAIKGFNSQAKVVMCSAKGQEGMAVQAIKNNGALDFIVKPFKEDHLLQTVKSALRNEYNDDF